MRASAVYRKLTLDMGVPACGFAEEDTWNNVDGEVVITGRVHIQVGELINVVHEDENGDLFFHPFHRGVTKELLRDIQTALKATGSNIVVKGI